MNCIKISDMEIARYLDEDAPYGDITTSALFVQPSFAKAYIQCKADCVIAGLEEARRIFEYLGCSVTQNYQDGATVEHMRKVMYITGDAGKILLGERLALNFLMKMSGIATLTAEFVKLAREVNPSVVIAATRKTTPGFRKFEKKAVMIGGGDPHRFSLSDAILLKDNHIAIAGGIEKAIELARRSGFTKKLEVEVRNIEEAEQCAKLGVDIILMDNFKASDAEEAYKRIKAIDRRIIVEISGGINKGNVKRYAKACDVISVGMLTHSYSSIDFSLEVI